MRLLRDVRIRTAVVAVAAVLVWLAILRSDAVAARLDWGLYVLSSLLISADLADLGLRYYLRRTRRPLASADFVGIRGIRAVASGYQKKIHVKPYALIASVHNAEHDLDEFLDRMEPYKERFWFIDDASTDRTAELLRYRGWRVSDGLVNRHKPGAIRRLVASLPAEICTVIVLDPDMSLSVAGERPEEDLDDLVFDFQRSGCAAACPRIRIHSRGLLAELQELEYLMSFELGRASLQDRTVTSGAGIYERKALHETLDQHSLSVYAEDLENAMILLAGGRGIYYESRLTIDTDAKTSWKDWFSQRVGWYFGLLKVFVERRREVMLVARQDPRTFYHYAIYTGLVTIALHPLRAVGVGMLFVSALGAVDFLLCLEIASGTGVTDPIYFLLTVSKYSFFVGLALVAMGSSSERLRLARIAPLYPLYAMAHVVPVTVGFLNYCSYVFSGSRLWSDHYQSDESLRAAGVGMLEGESR